MNHEIYMSRCLELAELGQGYVSPNPLVGCVIVLNGNIVAEGWHAAFGKDHAERMAISKIPEATSLAEATVYVNLEPCAHFGKTPPCANLLVEKGVKRVVIGQLDPNPLVAGKGVEILKDAGIDVLVGVMEMECRTLNRVFLKHMVHNRPYIALKWAETADGFIAPLPKKRYQITGSQVQTITHTLRRNYDAILVGVDTWEIDKPQLNNRLVEGPSPKRIIIDPSIRGVYTQPSSDESDILILNRTIQKSDGKLHFVQLNFDDNFLQNLQNCLLEYNIYSVLIEGGVFTISKFLYDNLWDEVHRFIGAKTLAQGLKAPEHPPIEKLKFRKCLGEDVYECWRKEIKR